MAGVPVEIPNRALFKATEVCELAGVPPYVLRSWEAEFPAMGVAKAPGAARVYRRADVELVLRIKQLVFAEGLTLGGARRRLDEEAAPVAADTPIDELLGRHARERLTAVKQGLRSLLDILSRDPAEPSVDYTLTAPPGPRPLARAAARGRVSKSSGRRPRRSPAR